MSGLGVPPDDFFQIIHTSTGRPGEGFALQSDQDSYDFAHQAQATVAPAWRNEVTMGSLYAILEHAPGRFIDLVAPRPLLMILAKDDAITPPNTIRKAFNRAGGPKRLLEIGGLTEICPPHLPGAQC
jgi:fermentation-respiration switch protein FrsA (DUF1100 family)